MRPMPWKTCMLEMAISSFVLIVALSPRERIICNGFLQPPSTPQNVRCQHVVPKRLEDWDHCNVEDWLRDIGFGRYSQGFASDFGGIGVDGDRLIYPGTEDQLDHIEYQLSLIGVDDTSDQSILGSVIIELVAASEVTPDLLESLVEMVPPENRDKKQDNDDEFGIQSNPPDFEI